MLPLGLHLLTGAWRCIRFRTPAAPLLSVDKSSKHPIPSYTQPSIMRSSTLPFPSLHALHLECVGLIIFVHFVFIRTESLKLDSSPYFIIYYFNTNLNVRHKYTIQWCIPLPNIHSNNCCIFIGWMNCSGHMPVSQYLGLVY